MFLREKKQSLARPMLGLAVNSSSIAVETLGPINASAACFLYDLGREFRS